MIEDTGSSPVPNPQAFAKAMEEHWTTTLGNTSSPALVSVWTQMAYAFGRTLMGIETRWQVLSPPTGSGKTQGTTLYCAQLAKENLRSDHQAGVLIVTRFKDEGQAIADTINGHVGQTVSRVHNSDRLLTKEELRQTMILVITHAALVKAFEGLTKDTQSRWPNFANWSHGRRKLVIVDEALSGIVEYNRLTMHSLAAVIGLARPYQAQHPAELQALEVLCQALVRRSEQQASVQPFMWTSAPEAELQLPPRLNLYALGQTLMSIDLDGVLLGTDSPLDQRRASKRIAETLRDAEAMLTRWSFYHRSGLYHTLNSALLLIPKDAPPVVILDATASQSELWHLLGERVTILPVPEGARSYRNVTLHVARSRGMGKGKMVDHAEARLSRLYDDLKGHLRADRKVLLCVHKAVEPLTITLRPEGRSYDIAHWGDIDGKNTWQTCDAVVLFGLPYRDKAWERSTITAIGGVASEQTEVEAGTSLQQRQLSVSVIQAINRVRCRRVVDGDGNCADTDAYLVLPPDEDGEAILTAIRQEMPGIQVKPWVFSPDGAKVPIRRGSHHEAILSFMQGQPPGIVYLKTIASALGIRAMKPIRDALNDTGHALTRALAMLGTTYVSSAGRGHHAYLLKSA